MTRTFRGEMNLRTALVALAGAYVRVVTSGWVEERLRALEATLSGRGIA